MTSTVETSKLIARTVFLFSCLLAGAGCTNQPVEDNKVVHIVALNDFHGYIQPSPYTYMDPDNPGETITVPAGGVAALSGLMRELRAQHPNLLFVAAGDLVGASPPISAMYADEPSIVALNMLGLDLTSLGNHELDEGKAELYRQIEGGCESPRPDKACQYQTTFDGSEYDYVAANLIDTDKGTTAVPPYAIKQTQGVRVAFVGALVSELSNLIPIASHAGLETTDEADAINAVLPEVLAQDVDVVVAVIHEGGFGHASANDCDNLVGPIVDIANRLDPAVDVLITGHTHEAYICQVGDLLVTQGHHYGHLVTHLQVSMNADDEVLGVSAKNIMVDPQRYTPDPEIAMFEADLVLKTSETLNRPIARIGATAVTLVTTPAGECTMGNLVADAQLAGTRYLGAQIALMNYDGIRSDLLVSDLNQPVTYNQIAAVHPFKGTLQIASLSGADIKRILEQQWPGNGDFFPLQTSRGFTYTWDAARPIGERISNMRLNGEPVTMTERYEVVASAFLMDGGDGFKGFTSATNRRDTGLRELVALSEYLKLKQDAGTPAGRSKVAGRVTRLN
ncbi:MAG: bifunctional metallophosphatase/5'-nucleotidase [Pseudomonadales bacterium]